MASVSVIIPTHNRTAFLQRTIDSVLKQSTVVKEILVIDDGSNEKFKNELAKICQSNSIVRLIKTREAKGVSFARNVGIMEAVGDYIIFLDDDDTLKSGYIEHGVRALEADSGITAIITRTEVLEDSSDKKKSSRIKYLFQQRWKAYPLVETVSISSLLIHCPMVHAFIFRRKAILPYRFRVDLKYGEDMWLWVQMLAQGLRFKWLDLNSSYVRIHPQNSSASISYNEKMKFHLSLSQSGFLSQPADKHVHYMRLFYCKLANRRIPEWKLFRLVFFKPLALWRFSWLHLKVKVFGYLAIDRN